ncbi:hypothetical protein H0H81_011171 [Sphagnurus paluster]|uniref:F-box domain-containing protein n=1 Tax=Sphagnurus paluster TaxID=117069 RepID=A0A9P7K3J6_9AGAR|nr:hypothetical protein H0H81_011171 [Sphagnurus paluster]
MQPPEILEWICSYLTYHDLRRFRAVCRYVSEAASLLLFQQIIFNVSDAARLEKFLEGLIGQNRIAQHVRTLIVRDGNGNNFQARLARFIEENPNLVSLKIDPRSWTTSFSLADALGTQPPKLIVLKVPSSTQINNTVIHGLAPSLRRLSFRGDQGKALWEAAGLRGAQITCLNVLCRQVATFTALLGYLRSYNGISILYLTLGADAKDEKLVEQLWTEALPEHKETLSRLVVLDDTYHENFHVKDSSNSFLGQCIRLRRLWVGVDLSIQRAGDPFAEVGSFVSFFRLPKSPHLQLKV